jgi:hypothetical protein
MKVLIESSHSERGSFTWHFISVGRVKSLSEIKEYAQGLEKDYNYHLFAVFTRDKVNCQTFTAFMLEFSAGISIASAQGHITGALGNAYF